MSAAAVDTRASSRSLAAFDTESRQDTDFAELVKAALLKPVPGKHKHQPVSHADIVQLHQLTQSKRKFVVDEALEVCWIAGLTSFVQN